MNSITSVPLQQRLIQTKERAQQIESQLGEYTEDQVLLKVGRQGPNGAPD